jgi:hypothetical protein
MATQTDFWGEIEQPIVRTPVAILKEQAALLGTKTKNLIEAEVYTDMNSGALDHHLYLVVPAMGYRYELLRFWHSATDLYPVTTISASTVQSLETEEQFVEWLRERLSSSETKRIVGNLLAQVNA